MIDHLLDHLKDGKPQSWPRVIGSGLVFLFALGVIEIILWSQQ